MLKFIIKLFKIIRFIFFYFFIPNSRIVKEAILEIEAHNKPKDYRNVYFDPKRVFRPNSRQVRRLKLITYY